ncbi:hypothetical protein FIV42_14835 [Persicimonas caeni]|uniref:Lactonase family protein n=1 Tax=Persicimonas caeni TaxID=2292766 RepID=A0A4Y6PVE8_PERCE|nr:hypothetical protein [Persicimonas caeni]QDG51967.1 hypothetical protein FIV42_14835 [Persicimonas caeni]QED33188.1 hypothetical protein FRD00_14830 [Persicimonas caeni]
MNPNIRKLTVLLLSAALLGACGDDDHSEEWDNSLRVGQPLRANGDLLFVNENLQQVVRLQPKRSGEEIDLEIDRASTGADPGARALSADESQLFVVNEELDEQGASLSVYDLSGESLSAQTVGLDSAYDRLSVDPEGEFLLLSFTGGGGNFVARNLNELGIVDLRDGIADDEEASFQTLSNRPRDIIFAPKFTLDGSEQRLAASLAESEVTIIDLLAEDEANRLREVPLTISQADQVRTPTQAIFDVTPEESMPNTVSLYLLTDTGQDITHVAIQPSIRQDANRKFDISVNQLAAGNNPARMKLLELDEQGSRIIAIDQNRPEFTMIDVQSGESSTFDLPMTAPAEDLLVYQTSVDGEPETRVLAWSSRSPLVSVIRPESIAISDDTPTLGRSVEAIRLKAAPSRVQLDEETNGERAIVHHAGLGAGFTVLNLRTNRAVPIQGASLGDIYFGQVYAYGVFRGEPYFGLFDLETGHPTAFELPKEGERIYLDGEDELLVVQHADRTGSFTLLNATNPIPENAKVFNDIFLENLFGQELP